MFETYKPSGKLGGMALPLWAVGILLMVPTACLYAYLLEWIPFIYVTFLITYGVSWLIGLIASKICVLGHVRNPLVAMMIAFSLALVLLVSKFVFQWLLVMNWLPPSSFLQHLELRMIGGWVVGGMPISGWFVVGVWAFEAGIIFYYSIAGMPIVSKAPYNETLNQWADEVEVVMSLPIDNSNMVETIKNANSVDRLLEIPIPKTDDAAEYAIYTVNSIQGKEAEDAYLSVSLMKWVQGSDGLEQVFTPLVQYAVLTSKQRQQLEENASLLNEAMEEFRQAAAEGTLDDDNDGEADEVSDVVDRGKF